MKVVTLKCLTKYYHVFLTLMKGDSEAEYLQIPLKDES